MRTSSTLYFPRDPFREFESLFRQAFTPAEPMDSAFSPAAEAHRDGDDAVIRIELPGVDVANDVSVEVLGRDLVVSGERRDERAEESEGRRLQEIRYGSFRRVFNLGRAVNADSISASYDAGVLTIRVAGVYAEVSGQRIAITTPVSGSVESGATEHPAVEQAAS
ncbi:MAG: Hsp20/alpha crystallin family protein [Nocardioidaceae bacterium]|nr:Hsp20/alpha crystallin family protein [Nocardioidaceae bacterium]